MLWALKVALDQSTRRSESQQKWTLEDQLAHEALVAAMAAPERLMQISPAAVSANPESDCNGPSRGM
jgi:hypothetical protein